MTDGSVPALSILARIRAQARAGAEALEGLNRAADALEDVLKEGFEGPFNGALNDLPDGATRDHRRGKIENDPELQAFIRACVTTMTFPELAAEVAANFPPQRRVAMSSIHRWWHRRGKAPLTYISKS